jgi:hypothetical protein
VKEVDAATKFSKKQILLSIHSKRVYFKKQSSNNIFH